MNSGSLRSIVKRVGDVGFAGLDFFRPRLRALAGEFAVGARERAGDGAPEQIGRGRDKTVRGEFVGKIAQVLVDAMDGACEHHRRHRALASCGTRDSNRNRCPCVRGSGWFCRPFVFSFELVILISEMPGTRTRVPGIVGESLSAF